jgi:hypothetical protein
MPPKKMKAAGKAENYHAKQENKLIQRQTGEPSAQASSAPASSAPASSAPASSAPASSAPASDTSKWKGPLNIQGDVPSVRQQPFLKFLGHLETQVAAHRTQDTPYSPSPSTSVSSADSERSVRIPASELKELLLYLPEDLLKHKSKRTRRDGGGVAAGNKQMFVFTSGDVAVEDWNSLRELIASCPDIFGDEDTSPSFDPRQNPSTEDPNEETVQDPERDPYIIEASREMFGLLLGQLLSIEDEVERYKWFEKAYEKSKSSLQDVFGKLKSPECFESKESKQMLVAVLGRLVNEGREFDTTGKSIPSTRNRKINQAFLDSKSSSATTIRFQTKEEFVIFILSIYADSIHDANRIEDTELKTKVVKLKKACAHNLVAKMYPTLQLRPSNVSKLLDIINESHKSNFETELMDHFAKISACTEDRPFDLVKSISESSGVIFTDNASMRNEVKKTNSVISIQTLLDAGASNRSDLCFFDPYNVRFIWESEPGAKEHNGEYYEFLVTQTVSIPSSSRRMDCKYFALDNFKRLSWRTGSGHKHHKKAVVERLPLCTIKGEMNGCFVSIMLRHVAERVWQQALKSLGEPDGLSALPLISLKWSGDSSMGIESVLGYENMCGFFLHPKMTTARRRLPYIVSTDTAMLPGNIKPSHAICERYNKIVEKNNNGHIVTHEELVFVKRFIDEIEVRRALISNDRSAHGGVILLLGAMLKATDSPVNPYCKSILVCSGDEMVKVNISGRQIIRTINRKPDVRPASLGLAGAGGIAVESTDDEEDSVAGSCLSQKSQQSYVNVLSFYLKEPQRQVPDTQQMLSSPSASPDRSKSYHPSIDRTVLFPKSSNFINFLRSDNDNERLINAISSQQITNIEFDNPSTLAQRLNAVMFAAWRLEPGNEGVSYPGITEQQNQKNITEIQRLIESFNSIQPKGGGFFTRNRIRNHHRTQYTNKRKYRSNKKSTIKHHKSHRKDNRIIKRRKSRRHHQ